MVIPSLFFFFLLEVSIVAFPSFLTWLIWFVFSCLVYLKRSRSFKTLFLCFLFLVWVSFVSRTYLGLASENGLLVEKTKILLHLSLAYISFLYFLSLNFLERKEKIRFWRFNFRLSNFEKFFYFSIFFLSAIFFFSGKLHFWWLNSIFCFAFLIFFFLIFLKKYSFEVKLLASFLFLEIFLSLGFLSSIPEIKAFIFSLLLIVFVFLIERYSNSPATV